MHISDWDAVVDAAVSGARSYLASLPERRVYPDASIEEIRAAVDVPLTDAGESPADVVAALSRDVEPFVAAHASGRYFGFVIGGIHPAAYGTEILTTAWDQNAGNYAVAPGASMTEEVAVGWLRDLLRLPPESSVALVTGGQMATFTCLAAARHEVLRASGWNVEADGLHGAPPVTVVCKTGRHTTVPRAMRFLGLGERTAVDIASDSEDRMDVAALREALAATDGPTIVCAEAGNVNTGAFDDFTAIADAVDEHRARGNPTWVHVDGAVGLLAAASPSMRHLTEGLDRLDSWSTDAHKLLNVTYDCGVAICRNAAAHRAAMSVRASYLIHDMGDVRESLDWNPEFSRRARGLPLYATLRSLGRDGVAALPERVHGLARRFADALAESGRAEIVNDVVFNQVLVRWHAPDGMDPDVYTDALVARIQREGTTYLTGTTWRGRRLMRVSVVDWATDAADIDRAAAAVLRCAEHESVTATAPPPRAR